MSTRFIYVESINEIDPSKATVYDLNKRYIDGYGNMYGLRYNRIDKKVEVIKLLRTTSIHADKVEKRMIEQRKMEYLLEKRKNQDSGRSEDSYSENEYDENEDYSATSKTIIPDIFIQERMDQLKTHKQRLEGLFHNFKDSNIINRDDRNLTNKVDELFRNLEIDCISKIDKSESTYRELTEYPRGISYYLAKFDKKAKQIVDSLYSDEKKMNYIIYFELFTMYREIYKNMEQLLLNIGNFLDEFSQEYIAKLSTSDKQHFSDTRTTITNTMHEVREIFEVLNRFELYLLDSRNFSS
ncbi:MAG: hypothetical protein JW982_09085 [Spirochaetes bacterium]|nr:hypothetical protein [Spirochaetota bacterium]